MDVSVIFATHNREDVLQLVFDAWRKVDAVTKYEYEIICSDDESTDRTIEIIENVKDLPITLIKNRKGGAGQARNAALKIAKGKIIIFTGDDMFPHEDFVNRHFQNYLKYGDSIATLGRIDWHHDIKLNHLMKHITEIGCEQFGFIALPSYQLIDFRHFYTSNISVPKKLLDNLDIHFSNQFDKYGFEDIELGYRLQKKGMNIFYDPSIIVEHHHIYESVEKFCVRQQNAGEELVVFSDIHDDLENKCICDIENCRNAFEKYAVYHNKKSFNGKFIGAIINFAKKVSKLLERILTNKDNNALKKICSVIYADLFQYYFFYGCANRINKNYNLDSSCVKQFTYLYLKKPFSQIYWDIGEGYNENDSRKWKCWDESDVILEKYLPPNVKEIRISPLKNRCKAKIDYIKFVKENSLEEKAEVYWHNACSVIGDVYDFTNTIDPQLVIKEVKEDYTKLIVKMNVEEMEKRGMVKPVKRFLRKVYSCIRTTKRATESWEINYAYGQGRKVQIGIDCFDLQKRKILIEQYQKAVAFLGENVCINDSNRMIRGYSDYVYKPIHKELEKTQFIQAVYTLLNNTFDYLIVSKALDEFPQVAGDCIEDVCIYSPLLKGDSIGEKCHNGVGKLLRLPAYMEMNNNFNLKDVIPSIGLKYNTILNCRNIYGQEFRISNRSFSYKKNKPMIFVIPVFLAVGGVERNTVEVMRQLKNEYDFCMITLERHTAEQGSLHYQLQDICEYIFDLGEICEFEHYLDILYELKKIFQPDLVWLCNNSPWLENNLLSFRKVFDNLPIVAQDVYDTKEGWIAYYDSEGVKQLDEYIAINDIIRKTFIEKYKIEEQKITLIYPVVDKKHIMEEKNSNSTYEYICEKYGLDKNKKHFATVGRIAEQKNPIRYLNMIKELGSEAKQIQFIMVGDGNLGDYVDKYIIDNNLTEKVKRIPYIANAPEFIKILDGLMIFSRYEGMPIVSIEAMSLGIPIMSTDVGDVKIFLDKTKGGIIIGDEYQDISFFKQFITNLDEYRKNAKKSEEEILEYFSVDCQVEGYKRCFAKGRQKYTNK